MKLETFLIFNQQFLTLIRAGLPILSVDGDAGEEAEERRISRATETWRRGWERRIDFAAFEAQGGFPLVYTTTLLAGERSGNLEEVLERYLDFQRIALTFRKKLTACLIYPAVLVVMVCVLFIFLITFVVPQFAEAV